MRASIIGLAVACSLWACTQATPQPPTPDPAAERATSALPATLDEAPLYVEKTVIEPTPEMLRAALSNDPDTMREAVATTAAASGCMASSSCPAEFGSCTNWSTPSLCSSTCGASYCFCRPIRLCEGEPPEPRGVDTYNAFRICFDSNANPCTEWQQTISTFCGC